MRVHPEELAAEHSDRPGDADRQHAQADGGDQIGVEAAEGSCPLDFGLACGFGLNDAPVEEPDRAEHDERDHRGPKVVLKISELLTFRCAKKALDDVGERDGCTHEHRDRGDEHHQVDRELADHRSALDLAVRRHRAEAALQWDPCAEPQCESGNERGHGADELEA